MPIQPVNGLQMHYEHSVPSETIEPSNKPVLLLSGIASDSASWQPIIARLQEHHELLIPDNRCTGRTTPIPIETSRKLMVADTLGLMDELQIEQVNIIGHSMGGTLGWALATEAPDRVSKLITASALPNITPARIALFKSLSDVRCDTNEAQWFALLYQFLFSPVFFNDNSIVETAIAASLNYPYKQDRDAFSQQVAGLQSFLCELDMSRVRCPVTMITGSNDILMSPSMLSRFVIEHPYVTTQVIDQAAHALHWEQPAAFATLVLETLAGQTSRRSA